MCGIVASLTWDEKGKKGRNVAIEVKDQFLRQRSRGTAGFGLVTIDRGRDITVMRTPSELDALIELRLARSEMVLFHHRTPTSTANSAETAHPILVRDARLKNDYLFMHNGIISNDLAMHEKLTKEGWLYNTEGPGRFNYSGASRVEWNDSESLAISVAMAAEGLAKEVEARGSAAFIMLEVDKVTMKATRLLWGRNDSNPLLLAMSRGGMHLSSEGKGEAVAPNELYAMDLDTKKVTSRKMTFPTYVPAATKAYDYPSATGGSASAYGRMAGTVPTKASPVAIGAAAEEKRLRDTLKSAMEAEAAEKASDAFDDAVIGASADDGADLVDLDRSTEAALELYEALLEDAEASGQMMMDRRVLREGMKHVSSLLEQDLEDAVTLRLRSGALAK